MTFLGALAGIIIGATTVLIWIYAPISIGGQSLSNIVYEIVPGFVLSSLAIVVVSLSGKEPSAETKAMFDTMLRKLKEQS